MLRLLIRNFSKSRRFRDVAKDKEIDLAFQQLKQDGKNTVENITKWLRSAKILTEKLSEEQTKKLFDGVGNSKVKLEKFREILRTIAKEKQTDVDEIKKMLVHRNNKFFIKLKESIEDYQKKLAQRRKMKHRDDGDDFFD